MHQQAQLRLNKAEVERLGAEAFVVFSFDLHRTRTFKEKNLLLSTFEGPFKEESSLVFATALSDPAGRAAAIFGVSRKSYRWGMPAENRPTWFVIDRQGILTWKLHPTFESPTSYVDDVNKVLEELRKAAGE